MPSMNVSLTTELMNMVQQKVEGGLYNNASEVIREALRQLNLNSDLLYELKLARLRETLSPGLDQAQNGDFAEYSLNDFIQELNNESHKSK